MNRKALEIYLIMLDSLGVKVIAAHAWTIFIYENSALKFSLI
jgi:hypothetical protein